MRCQIVAELATAHGGDVGLAIDMVHAAAGAGADWVKIQTYDIGSINPKDPQREWLRKAYLSRDAHRQIQGACKDAGVGFLSTPFDASSVQQLRELGCRTFKVASSESSATWWEPEDDEHWILSWPWGQKDRDRDKKYLKASRFGTRPLRVSFTHLTAIPLYPTPLECVGRAPLLDGWSDHAESLNAAMRAIALGAKLVEVHFSLPGHGRNKSFDKSPDDLELLRGFADACATMGSGVGQVFRDRWTR